MTLPKNKSDKNDLERTRSALRESLESVMIQSKSAPKPFDAVEDGSHPEEQTVPEYGFVRYKSTMLMCDVRGFTTFFDGEPPEAAYQFITSFLRKMSAVVVNSHGRIITLTGDGFLAQFGSINSDPRRDAFNAVACVLDIRDCLKEINEERARRNEFLFSAGIGINSGTVAAGAVEYNERSFQLLLGDTINTASRIENLCKLFSVDILMSESTEHLVRGLFHVAPKEPIGLRGKEGMHRTFAVEFRNVSELI